MRSVKHQRQLQSGFTLIELIIVIVIIGILSAVAIPKFLTLSDDAKLGVAKGIAAAAASASAINYAAVQGGLTSGTTMTNCTALQAKVSLPTGNWSITGTLSTGGVTNTCSVVDGTAAHSTTFIAYGA